MAAPIVSSVSSNSSNGNVTVTWQTDVAADTQAAVFFGPAKHCSWNWQLTGTVDTSASAQVYDFDAFENNASLVTSLHASGVYCIAYFSAGSWENWRPDAASFPANVLGNNLSGWPGEKWLDVTNLAVLRPIMAARADIAKSKGFDAIEWDCVDVYTQASGFTISAAQNIAYIEMVAQIAHERGMGAFLKNDPGQITTLAPFFEGSIGEEAYHYSESALYQPFTTANKPVLLAEYSSQYTNTINAADANANGFSLILQTLNLNTKYVASYVTNPAPAVTLGGNATQANATLSTNHSLTFGGLTNGQTYGFLVWSTNAGGTTYDATPRTFVASGTPAINPLQPIGPYFAVGSSWSAVSRRIAKNGTWN